MQQVRRLLSLTHRNPSIWHATRDASTSGLSPLTGTAPLLLDYLPLRSVSIGHGLLNIKHLNIIMQSHASKWQGKLMMDMKCMNNRSLSGRNLCVGSIFGISVVAGAVNFLPNVTYAMNGHVEEHHSDSVDPSDFLKQDLDTVWALTKKFQLPAVLLLTVIFGWHHPFILAINVALLLFCTRPNPFSVYIFIEQLRRRAMRQNPGLYKTKLFYAKKVEVRDYKLLCFAKVELRDAKLSLIGILGSWWILQSSSS
uniref:Protein MGF 360-10L n=1 Tax=Anthurium amnicola TaxID=1678845 RepID=A0A1D1Y4V7_9ARAE